MFSGIVRCPGRITAAGENFAVESALFAEEGARPGDSYAVSGVCLTVTRCAGQMACFDLGSETRRCTTLGALAAGERVNLEPALRYNQPVHGHFVQGHVDCTSAVRAVTREANTLRAEFELPPQLARYLVPKGAIAVDGVSLTVGETGGGKFSVYLIPHTVERTTLDALAPGRLVNLEADCLAKYLEQLAAPYKPERRRGLLW